LATMAIVVEGTVWTIRPPGWCTMKSPRASMPGWNVAIAWTTASHAYPTRSAAFATALSKPFGSFPPAVAKNG
jgi:hypothetical protein